MSGFSNFCLVGVCRMNHDAKFTGGIFRRRPSTASTSSRLSVQSGPSGSVSCPVSPRHTKHLPAVPTFSSAHFHDVLTSTTSNNFQDRTRIHRSPSASNTYNYRPQSSNLYSYTGKRRHLSRFSNRFIDLFWWF